MPSPEADPPEPDRDEQDGDRDHDVATEDARVLEEGRDAEVGRVRIRALDVSREEMSVRQPLEKGYGGEQAGQGYQRCRERPGMPRTEGRASDGDDECGERKQKEEELDRPLARIPGPEERDPGEGDEHRRGDREQRWQRSPHVAPQGPDHEGEDGGREDGVEREQEVGLLRPDRDGDPERCRSEEHDRDDRRVASERRGAGSDQENADNEGGRVARRADELLEIRCRDEGRCERSFARHGHGQAGQELSART